MSASESHGVRARAITAKTPPERAQKASAARITAQRASPSRSRAKRKSALTMPNCANVAPAATKAVRISMAP